MIIWCAGEQVKALSIIIVINVRYARSRGEGMMIELAKEILKSYQSHTEPVSHFAHQAAELAQAVIDRAQHSEGVGVTKGERMPQTPEDFAYMADRYEDALLREKEENSQLRAKVNKLEQKVTKAKAEGLEEAAKMLQGDAEYYKAHGWSEASLALQDAERKIRARIKR